MAMRSGMYSSNKRKKELSRKKKQEEKRLKRQKNVKDPSQDPSQDISQNSEVTDPVNAESDSFSVDTPEVTDE